MMESSELNKAAVAAASKHAVILSKHMHVSMLILLYIHNQLGHAGRNHMLSRLKFKVSFVLWTNGHYTQYLNIFFLPVQDVVLQKQQAPPSPQNRHAELKLSLVFYFGAKHQLRPRRWPFPCLNVLPTVHLEQCVRQTITTNETRPDEKEHVESGLKYFDEFTPQLLTRRWHEQATVWAKSGVGKPCSKRSKG